MQKFISTIAAIALCAAPAFAQGSGSNGPTTDETSSKGTGVPQPAVKQTGPDGKGKNGPGTDTTSTHGTGTRPSGGKHAKTKTPPGVSKSGPTTGPNGANNSGVTDPAIKPGQ